MPYSAHKRRLTGLRAAMKDASMDSFLITGRTNIAYLSGFGGTDAVMLVTGDYAYLLVDSRFIEEAEKEAADGVRVSLIKESMFSEINNFLQKDGARSVGFESMDLPYGVAQRLKGALTGIRLVPARNLIQALRSVKDASEIIAIRSAVKLAREVFDRTASLILPGTAESAIKKAIEIDILNNGSSCAFEPIVASGANSSKPHARATQRTVAKDDFVMVDMGARVDGYNSDLTRTIVLGRVKDRFRKIYRTVSQAQSIAIDRIRAGARASDIDKAGRDYIAKKGFGKYFGHSLGHGIGMDVHEEPSISSSAAARLTAGMVFTVEPAIYIPGFGGVRIEDMVLVTKNGCEILTR